MAAAKLERLLNLTALLLDAPRPLARDDIRAKVPGYPEGDEAFRRQFERDKDDLRAMGIPLSVETVPGVLPEVAGYRIPADQYYLADPGLDPDELAALHLAASAVRIEGLSAGDGLAKLGPRGRGDPGDLGVEVAALPGGTNLAAAFAACSERHPVTFEYRGRSRRIDPHRLDLRRGRWYLQGLDHDVGELRTYRLDRVEGGITLDHSQTFEVPEPAVPGAWREPWELGEEAPLVARVRIDGPPAPAVAALLGPDAVREHDGDAVVVELEVAHRDGFRSFVLGLLDHAEVLEPPELRDEVVHWLEELAR